jgi:hypothetical protein
VFNTQKTILENKVARAMKGEDTFQDAELDHWKIESNIHMVKRELIDVVGRLQHVIG